MIKILNSMPLLPHADLVESQNLLTSHEHTYNELTNEHTNCLLARHSIELLGLHVALYINCGT